MEEDGLEVEEDAGHQCVGVDEGGSYRVEHALLMEDVEGS